MTDDRLARALTDAIAELAGTSAPDYLDTILERTSRTRQRPWWTFPSRYPTMSTTLKFATAAALAFAVGIGVGVLVAPGDGRPSTAPAAEDATLDTLPVMVTETADPVSAYPPDKDEFRARWLPGEPAHGNEEARKSGGHELWRVTESSDPRLDGTLAVTYHKGVATGAYASRQAIWELGNDAGGWTSAPALWWMYDDMTSSTISLVLTGSGEYDGLTAIADVSCACDGHVLSECDVRGLVVKGDIGAPPEISQAE